ncbi:MAG: glycosyltransferase family 2 protein [Ekhidna sp.]|uniref:glycosyltransferase family 2 protein n=1 Tax=Ekhidna sp. TaxID=2608089 RepID=UPI0032EF5FCA
MHQSNKPVLSVIMPVYNAEKYVAQAIESILSQSFEDFELLLADDGSIDNSRQVIEKFRTDKRVTITNNETNLGKVVTVNRLFKNATGEYVTVHDADDWSYLNRFQAQIDYLKSNPEIGFCGTNFYNEENSTVSKSDLKTDSFELKEALSKESQMHGPTIIARSELLNTVYRDFFDGYGEDYDMTLRLLDKSLPGNLKEHLYHYRNLRGSLSKKITPRKLYLHEIARILWRQRIDNGIDDLESGNQKQLETRLEEMMGSYMSDKSLIHIKQAELSMYYGFKKEAILETLKAIYKNPFKARNYNTLQYCVRKTLLGF